MNILNIIRRLLPDFIVSDPSVTEIISRFESVRAELNVAIDRAAQKARDNRAFARQLEARAAAQEAEAARAEKVRDRIASLID